jgi:hypothetical protein
MAADRVKSAIVKAQKIFHRLSIRRISVRRDQKAG